MPIYAYVCQQCDHSFDRLWRSAAAAEGQQPGCPGCGGSATRRAVSHVSVLGGLGGLTPREQSAAGAEEARRQSFTPREEVRSLQANRQKKREQGR